MSAALHVLIAGQLAGIVRQQADGALTFRYDPAYAGVPLSLSMPVTNRTFTDKTVRPFLFGLLPDSFEVRRSVGREYGVSGNNPFALLSHIGLDCPGAVQFCAEDGLRQLPREGALTPVSDEQIGRRLAKGRTDLDARWETAEEHWSLGGQQSKFALRQQDGRWYSCEGAQATTHILKPGIPHLMFEALNEFICLKTAKTCGVPAAEVEYRLFDGEAAIVVSRYDRVRDGGGNVLRLHQEDFCQVLGILPENKYASEGGPSANDVIAVCKRTGEAAARNIAWFIDMLLLNYLLGAPDAHAKNYSLLLDRDAALLAPLYDMASMLPYTDRPFDVRMAMGIAGENRIGHVSARRLSRFAEMNRLQDYGITGEELAERLAALATRLPKGLRNTLEDHADLQGIDELAERLLPKVENVCTRSIARLD